MILGVECIIGCIIFGSFIVLSVLKNQEFWIQEYPEVVQRRYLEMHPDCKISQPQNMSLSILSKKLVSCVIFIVLLTCMVYYAGARSFSQGTLYSYTIWFVVNAFDTFVIDIGLMAHWKKCRLPGTEDMDEAYKLLYKKSFIDGLYGCGIGIPISIFVGALVLVVL